jgi:hypothetical protein
VNFYRPLDWGEGQLEKSVVRGSESILDLIKSGVGSVR